MSIVCDLEDREKLQAARQAAGRIIGHPKPFRVSKRSPCPVCGHDSYCCHDDQAGVTLCTRESGGAVQDDCFRPVRIGEFGFLHVRRLSDFSVAPAPRLAPRPRKVIIGLPEIVAAAIRLTQQTPFSLDLAAAELGLPRWTLETLRVGFAKKFDRKNWTVPERDASGGIIGIQYRPWGGGTKLSQEGGSRGLCYADGWRDTAIRTGCVFLPEGMSDTAALMAMGLAAVGRPSNTGGVDLLAELLTDLPAAVRIVVLAEHDGGPGVKGAESTRAALAKRLGRPVEALLPPDDAKDTRVWFNAQRPRLDAQAALAELGQRFTLSLCGLVADCLLCCDSSHTEENHSVTFRHNANNQQTISKQSANTNERPAWSIPKRIRQKYDSDPRDCPKAPDTHWKRGRKDGSPILLCFTCRKWSCPICADYLRLKAYGRFGARMAGHDGQLYHDVIPDWDWKAVLQDMRRRSKKLGVPLRFFSIRDEFDSLTIVASIPVRSDIARPVELSEALDLLESALDNVADTRPITSCRQWGKLPTDKQVELVPGCCMPAPFYATLKAWKAKALESKRLIECDRPGLFFDSEGKFNASLQDDFWRECEIRQDYGDEAADKERARLAAEREQRKRNAAAAPTCNHDCSERPDPERPGWLVTRCDCGNVFKGSRPAGVL